MATPAFRARAAWTLLAALALVLALQAGRAGPPAPDGLAEDEKLLRDAGLPTDGPGLARFFRDRTPSPGDRERLTALVGQLGSNVYGTREKATRRLTAAGERALPFLRPALASPDAEVRRRAERCVAAIERVPHAAQVVAAARLLAHRRPPGAAEVLLAYLPSADWPADGDDLLDALAAVGLSNDAAPVPAVVAAAADPEPARRAAAAHVLGRAAAGHRGPAVRLLADPSPLVRYHAGASLTLAGDRRGVPALVALLGEGPAPLAFRAEELLDRLAGERAPAPVPGVPEDPAARKRWRAAWQGWWQAHGAKLDLARLKLGGGPLGLTLDCEVDGLGQFPGRVCAFDRGGNLRWCVEKLDSPADVRLLRSGRLLVAEHWAKRVTERDRRGHITWEQRTDNHPVSAERLRNGNTLVATLSEILEVAPGGKVVLSYKHTGGMIYCARKLDSGRVLFIDGGGRVSELDASGRQVLTFVPQQHAGGAGMWASIEPLPGGRYLIALCGSNKVVETDASGKIYWECSTPSPAYAARLPGGNTLVASVDGRFVSEVDRQGKEVWRKATKGRPFRARRY
jgi:hypothetical protein